MPLARKAQLEKLAEQYSQFPNWGTTRYPQYGLMQVFERLFVVGIEAAGKEVDFRGFDAWVRRWKSSEKYPRAGDYSTGEPEYGYGLFPAYLRASRSDRTAKLLMKKGLLLPAGAYIAGLKFFVEEGWQKKIVKLLNKEGFWSPHMQAFYPEAAKALLSTPEGKIGLGKFMDTGALENDTFMSVIYAIVSRDVWLASSILKDRRAPLPVHLHSNGLRAIAQNGGVDLIKRHLKANRKNPISDEACAVGLQLLSEYGKTEDIRWLLKRERLSGPMQREAKRLLQSGVGQDRAAFNRVMSGFRQGPKKANGAQRPAPRKNSSAWE